MALEELKRFFGAVLLDKNKGCTTVNKLLIRFRLVWGSRDVIQTGFCATQNKNQNNGTT
jgi:hypothetical protein